jgi:hypothetical protein
MRALLAAGRCVQVLLAACELDRHVQPTVPRCTGAFKVLSEQQHITLMMLLLLLLSLLFLLLLCQGPG